MLVEHARAGRADGSSPPGRRHLVLSARAVEFREEETVVKRWAAVRRRNKVLVIAAVALLAVPAAAFAHDSAWVFTGETGILSSDAIDQSGANCDGTFGIPFAPIRRGSASAAAPTRTRRSSRCVGRCTTRTSAIPTRHPTTSPTTSTRT